MEHGSETAGDKLRGRKGNSPDLQLRSLNMAKWERWWDFADNQVKPVLAYFKGVENVAPWFFYSDDPGDRRKFFWTYYKPLISSILDQNARQEE